MTNRLSKRVDTVVEVVKEGSPSIPAYCVEVEKEGSFNKSSYAGENDPSAAADILGGDPYSLAQGIESLSGIDIASLSGPSSQGAAVVVSDSYGEKYANLNQVECFDAVPAVPAEVVELSRPIIGWNAGASSIEAVTGAGFFSWVFSPTISAAVVGVSTGDYSTAIGEPTHALYANGTASLSVMERGEIVHEFSGVDLTGSPRCYIARDAIGEVHLYVPALGLYYKSTNKVTGALFLDAALYVSGDYVDSPSLGTFSTLSGSQDGEAVPLSVGLGLSATVRRVERTNADGSTDVFSGVPGELYIKTGLGITARALVAIDGAFLTKAPTRLGITTTPGARSEYALSLSTGLGFQVSVRDSVAAGGAGVSLLPAITGIASEGEYAVADAVLPAITGFAESGQQDVQYATHDADLPSLQGTGIMYTGGYLTHDADLPPIGGIASEGEYALQPVGLMPAIRSFSYGGFGTRTSRNVNEPIVVFSYWLRPVRIYAEFTDGLEISPAFDALITVYSDWNDGLEITGEADFDAVLSRILRDGLAISSRSSIDEIEAIQYAMNLGTTGVTRYTGYQFDGYASASGRTFGWDSTGVYELIAGDDAGTGIDAQADFGTFGGGDLKAKHMDAVYLGVSTDGTLYMKLDADGKGERVYTVRRRQAVSKVLPGRGVTGRQWRVKLELVSASDFDLDSIEYVVGVSSRRWVR